MAQELDFDRDSRDLDARIAYVWDVVVMANEGDPTACTYIDYLYDCDPDLLEAAQEYGRAFAIADIEGYYA